MIKQEAQRELIVRSGSSVGHGTKRIQLDAADTGTVDDGELDVALVTPGGVPGVLDEPVVLTVLSAVADGEDGVVEAGAATGGVEDTRLVGLEDELVSLDRDGKGLLGESGLHLAGAGGGHSQVVRDSDGGSAGLIVLAGVVSAGVGVDRLELGLVTILVVVVGLLLKATAATVVAVLSGSAVNELLLREGLELTSGEVVGTLEGASGGESPA